MIPVGAVPKKNPLYSRSKVFGRLALGLAQTLLDYFYVIAANYEIKGIRAVLIFFLIFYPCINFIVWNIILGYIDMKYNQIEYKSFKDIFGKNWVRNMKTAFLFGLFSIFHFLPFYIYIKIYNDHNAIFTEQLVDLLMLEKQRKKIASDEEKGIKSSENNNIIPNMTNFGTARQITNSFHKNQSTVNNNVQTEKNEDMQPSLQRQEPTHSRQTSGNKFFKVIQAAVKSRQSRSQTYLNSADSSPFPEQIQFKTTNNFRGEQEQGFTQALKKMGGMPTYNFDFKQNLKTQIAIEANCKFSLFSIVEESNFQMLFESGEIMEMAFKSFPVFGVQLCNDMIEDSWVQNWFTLLYFIILAIRIIIVGGIFIKVLLLNNKMLKFLEIIRYFNDEMDEVDILKQTQQQQQVQEKFNSVGKKYLSKPSYPMPEVLQINQVVTLNRMNDLSNDAGLCVKNLVLAINNDPKSAEIIIKSINSSIQRFQQLNKVSLNLQNNALGSKKVFEIASFLIQSLVKCKEVSLFFDGNGLAEEEIHMIKAKFDNNPTYEKFYFQSEKLIMIFDRTGHDFMRQLHTFYKRIFIDPEDFYLNSNFDELKKKSFRTIENIDKDGQSKQELIMDCKIKQLYITVPSRVTNSDEQAIIMKILTEVKIGYLEIEINFDDKQFYQKLEEAAPYLKFHIGYIIADFFKNGKLIQVQTQKSSNFSLNLPIENNKLEVKPLSITGSKGLSKMIRNHSRIFNFDIKIPDNLVTNHGIIMISSSLPNQCINLNLDFSNNMLGDLGCMSLATKLNKMTKLLILSICLRNNKFLSQQSMDAISDSFLKMAKLKELTIDFRSMEITSKHINKFFAKLQLLKNNKIDPVQQLVVDLSKNFGTSEKVQVSEKGSYNLGKSLEKMTGLKFLTLDISSNNIDSSGASFVFKAFSSLSNLNVLKFNISDNYIKRVGIMMFGQSLKKLSNVENLELFFDQVKKPNTSARRTTKHTKGDQRMQLDSLMKSEQKPLKIIFKKIGKFNKSTKELKKFVTEEMTRDEEATLQRYISLNNIKDGATGVDSINKEDILKYLSIAMESNLRTYQVTARKLSSFEDLFSKLSFLTQIKVLRLSLTQNSLVNMDFGSLGQALSSLVNLNTLTLNMSQNSISDKGVKPFFEPLSQSQCLLNVSINLSSNMIKYEGAQQMQYYIQFLQNRTKLAEDRLLQILKTEKIQRRLKNKSDHEVKSHEQRKSIMRSNMRQGSLDDMESKNLLDDNSYTQRKNKQVTNKILIDSISFNKKSELERSGTTNQRQNTYSDADFEENEIDEEELIEQDRLNKLRQQIDYSKVPPRLQSFQLNMRNNNLGYNGGYSLMEAACKLNDEGVEISFLMGNCGIITEETKDDQTKYGFFHILKKSLKDKFEFE